MKKYKSNDNKRQQGFTLLEVLVSITLTSLVLGNLFALQSQSKRLSFKAQTSMLKTINNRAYLNASWISNRDEDAYLSEISDSQLSISDKNTLKKPVDKIIPEKYSLESFSIVDQNNEIILSTVRLKESIIKKRR
ncbi:MAG: prepilin-type N-terminal cleavage/methylation domain-containing protein [Gammaproteobacteria bacterium]|nr:prepilin-type N-terminal cleavage/methylation domain-containing protein [Gammaproteobacteria bacterium]